MSNVLATAAAKTLRLLFGLSNTRANVALPGGTLALRAEVVAEPHRGAGGIDVPLSA